MSYLMTQALISALSKIHCETTAGGAYQKPLPEKGDLCQAHTALYLTVKPFSALTLQLCLLKESGVLLCLFCSYSSFLTFFFLKFSLLFFFSPIFSYPQITFCPCFLVLSSLLISLSSIDFSSLSPLVFSLYPSPFFFVLCDTCLPSISLILFHFLLFSTC